MLFQARQVFLVDRALLENFIGDEASRKPGSETIPVSMLRLATEACQASGPLETPGVTSVGIVLSAAGLQLS